MGKVVQPLQSVKYIRMDVVTAYDTYCYLHNDQRNYYPFDVCVSSSEFVFCGSVAQWCRAGTTLCRKAHSKSKGTGGFE